MNTEQRLISLTFKDPLVEKAYNKENRRKSMFQVQLASGLSTVLYAAFILLDMHLFPDKFQAFLITRIIVSSILFTCFALSFKIPDYTEEIVFSGVIFAQAGHFVMMYYAGGIPDYGYAVTIIMLVFLFTFSRVKYRTSLIVLGLVLIIYQIMLIGILEYPGIIVAKNNFFLISVSVACMLSGYVIERYIRVEYIQSLKAKERAEELDQAKKQAEIASTHKSRFTANMSHELRTPLNAVKGITDLLVYGSFSVKRLVMRKIKYILDTLTSSGETGSEEKALKHELEKTLSVLKSGGALDELFFMQLAEQTSKLHKATAAPCRDAADEIITLLKREKSDTENAHKRIRESGNFLLEIINKALDLAKIEAGKIEIHQKPVNIRSLMQGVLRYAENYAKGKGRKNTVIRHEIDKKIPESVLLDDLLTRQILLNFLSNAVKYSNDGEVVLRVSAENKTLRFSVSDQGPGIKDEEKKIIFSEFGRLKDYQSVEGSGLGLALCSQLVEKLGGTIGFESEYGKGSIFWFVLPLQEAGNLS